MEYVIHAEVRPIGHKNKSRVKQLRRAGKIPAIVYGNHKEPLPIMIQQSTFRKEFSHISESILIDLHIKDMDARTVLIKDFTQDLVRDEIQHIDFYEIERGKILTTHLSIALVGSAIGNRQGGIIEHLLHELEIECLPKDLPEILELDITNMHIGDSIHVSELPQLPGVTYRASPEQVVIHISAPRHVSIEPEIEEEVEVETQEEAEEK